MHYGYWVSPERFSFVSRKLVGWEWVSQRAAVAVEYEKVFAAEAKKRHSEAVARANANRSTDNPCREKLPDMEPAPDYHASDEAGDLFQVSGRSVRDAKYVAEHDPEAFVKHGGSWAYALKVARWVEHGSRGGDTSIGRTSNGKVTPNKFADTAGVSNHTVRKYLKAWDYASEVGLVTHSTRIAPGVDNIIGGIDRSGRLTSFVILSTRVTPNLSLADSSRSCNLLIGQMLSLTPNSCVGNKVVAPVLYC